MSSSPIAAVSDVLSSHVPHTASDYVPATACDRRDLAETLASVPDPRRRRGVRHPFAPLLAAVTCAMLAGSRTFAAIAEWIADLPAADEAEIPTFIMFRRLLLLAWVGSHADTVTAQQLGPEFAGVTCDLAERYLAEHA